MKTRTKQRPRSVALGAALWMALCPLLVFKAFGDCLPPPSGLVSWWSAEGTANDIAGANNGTLLGGVSFAGGRVGLGFNLDGADGRIDVPDSPSLNFGPGVDFSIEAWIMPLPSTTDYGIMSIVDKRTAPTASQSQGYEFSLSNGKLITRISDAVSDNGSSYGGTGPDLRDGKFHHVALTVARSLTNGSVFYVDGQAIGTFDSTTEPGDLSNSDPLRIGYNAVGSLHTHFKGIVDEVSIYNRALSASEILSIYNAAGTGKCSSIPPVIVAQPANQAAFAGDQVTFNVLAGGTVPLTYLWQFSGTTFLAATTNSLTLTNVQPADAGNYSVQVTNAVSSALSSEWSLTVAPPPPCDSSPSNLVSWWQGEANAWDQLGGNSGTVSNNVTFGPGRVGQGFVFDGNGAVVRMGNPANLRMQDLTIEAWIRRASLTVASLNGNGDGFLFGYDSSGYALFLGGTGRPGLTKTGVNDVRAAGTITDLNFHHVAVTKSGSAVVFYIDGVSNSAFAYNPGFTFSGTAWIGGIGTNNSFFGSVDELSVYDRALSETEIQGIYSAALSGKCLVSLPPFITTQPSNQTAVARGSVSLSVGAGGSPPLSYQWSFNGTNIVGATNNPLILTNLKTNQSGLYSVVITNSLGYTNSSNALLTVILPTPAVRVATTNTAAGGIVSVPVTLTANGNENALGFSLNFDTAKLTYASATLGSGASGGVLMPNTSLINSGKLGINLALPPGATFAEGTQEVIRVTFVAAVLTNAASATNSFGDQPTPRQLLDAQINPLAATYSNGTVTISAATAFEGDVFPRPNGDKTATLSDWLLMGRYAARLDYPTNASEFQRADCAPRSTLGDGVIKVSDWVQSGRYAAGLDPLTPIGGPTNEIIGPDAGPSASRLVTAGSLALVPGDRGALSISLAAQGNENALGFSLAVDPARVNFTGAALGSGATGATLYLNTNQIGSGRLGFALALAAGNSFAAGSRELVRVSFQALGVGSFSPSFTDLPVPREVSDAAALALPVSYANGTVTVSPPSLRIARAGTNVLLAWPLGASNYLLQEASNMFPPSVTWSNLSVSVVSSNNENVVTRPVSGTRKFYRLHLP